MPHVLVLNASYEPLGVVPLRRALVLVLENKAICLEESGAFMHSATRAVPAPSVVRLKRFVRVPYRGPVPLTRRALFARDGGRCMYCGAAATSVDHVIPRSRGGQHAWDNVVAACRRCNHVKADRHLPELGWRLHQQPAPRRVSPGASSARDTATRAGCRTCNRSARTTRWPGSTASQPERSGPLSFPGAGRGPSGTTVAHHRGITPLRRRRTPEPTRASSRTRWPGHRPAP